MSRIPKAKNSNITGLTVHPDRWDHYPSIDHSTITTCHFENVSSSTKIDRCTLQDVTLESKGQRGGCQIDRSSITDCEIVDSSIDRSELKGSTLVNARVDRSPLQTVRLAGSDVRVDRCQLERSEVTGKSSLERSKVLDSLLQEARVSRSTVEGSFVSNSTLDRATALDCDVSNCTLDRTEFKGMILRNGRWKDGDLVARIDPTKEVTIVARSEVLAAQSAPRELPPAFHIGISQSPVPSRTAKDAEAASELESGMRFNAEEYDGPRIDTPPPYEPSTRFE